MNHFVILKYDSCVNINLDYFRKEVLIKIIINLYFKVVEVANYECGVSFLKFKMSGPIWQPKFFNLIEFTLNLLLSGF